MSAPMTAAERRKAQMAKKAPTAKEKSNAKEEAAESTAKERFEKMRGQS